MTALESLKRQIESDMVPENRHEARIKIGCTVGGHLAAGNITATEADTLEQMVLKRTETPDHALKEWRDAIEYGQKKPLPPWKESRDKGRALDWNDFISNDGPDVRIEQPIPPHTIKPEPKEIEEPSTEEWKPTQEAIDYLNALYLPHEKVGYVTESWCNKADKHVPTKGFSDRTAETLIEQLKKYPDSLAWTFGDWNQEAGAWIRFIRWMVKVSKIRT